MKNKQPVYHYFLLGLILIGLVLGCSKILTDEEVVSTPDETEIFRIIENEGIPMNRIEIREAMRAKQVVSQCTWDLDIDGRVATSDLLLLVQKFGTEYDQADLLELLSMINTSYIVDVIPLWSNFIQGSSCDTDWTNFPRYRCDGTLVALPIQRIDSVHWIQNDEIIWTDPLELDWMSFSDCVVPITGYEMSCNGLQEVTQRIFVNGNSYSRANLGWAKLDNGPGDCSGSIIDFQGMSYNAEDYSELEFLD